MLSTISNREVFLTTFCAPLRLLFMVNYEIIQYYLKKKKLMGIEFCLREAESKGPQAK